MTLALPVECVFGSAMEMSRSSYREYLLVGILVQTVLLTSTNTGIGLAMDTKQCMMDLFRAFPVRELLGPWPSPRVLARIPACPVRTPTPLDRKPLCGRP